MLFQRSWAVLLLCTTAGFLGWLGLAAPPEKENLWETWMRSALDETPVVQLMEDITHWMGNVSSSGAAELQEGHQVVPFNLHQEQERTQDVHPQLESNLVLQEVMEKLRRVNQSLELMLMALEDAQSWLEKHLEHLKAIPDPDGQSRSATSSCIPQSSYFVLLVLLLVPAPLRTILLVLLFLASSTLGIPAISTLLVLAVPGYWLVAFACHGARRIQLVAPQEEPQYQLTSTPERECNMELLQEELDKMEMSCVRESSFLEQPQEVARNIPGFAGRVSPVPGGRRTTLSSCGVTPELVMDVGKRWEPKPCSPRANMSPCQGLTRAGQRCRKKTIPGQEFCHIHTTSSSLAMDSSPHF
ncbi:protein brambleberry-like [Cyanocitta cristata]